MLFQACVGMFLYKSSCDGLECHVPLASESQEEVKQLSVMSVNVQLDCYSAKVRQNASVKTVVVGTSS